MPATTSVVVPVYNNASTVLELIARILAVFDGHHIDGEVVLVEDGSVDESWKLISRASAEDRRVVGLKHSRNFGQHPAIAAGFERARGDVVVLMDADLQDCPEEIPALLERLDDGADVVFTTWTAPDGAVRERWTSRAFHQVFSRLAGLDLPRNLGTFRAMTRDYRDAVLAYPERAAVYGPLMAQMGFEQGWLEVERQPAADGRSGYTFRKRLNLAMNTIVAYADLPYRILIWGGSTLMIATFAYLAVLLVQYALGGDRLPGGFTLLLSVQVLLSGAILLGIGVTGSYLHRVYREVLDRPRSHVARALGDGLEERP